MVIISNKPELEKCPNCYCCQSL